MVRYEPDNDGDDRRLGVTLPKSDPGGIAPPGGPNEPELAGTLRPGAHARIVITRTILWRSNTP